MLSEGEGQMLVLFQPAGSMEEFFHAMSKNFGKDIPRQTDKEVMRKLWGRTWHGDRRTAARGLILTDNDILRIGIAPANAPGFEP